jgi:Fe-S-cluster-containing hydrogenase component 2
MKENSENNSRRDFLRKLAGFTAVVGMASAITMLESCSQLNDTYSVSSSLCNGCKKCSAVCGAGAISFSNNKASISSSKCAGCGKCARVCPQGAIS